MRSLWLVVVLCLLLTATGAALMLIYVPSTTPAAQTRHTAGEHFGLGYSLRGIHFWSAQAVFLVMLAHLIRVLTDRVYRPLTVVMISGLLAIASLIILLWFTGFLLPWDQLAYWLAEWSTGHGVRLTLLGLYKTHVFALPILTALTVTRYIRILRKGRLRNLPF